MRFSFKGCFINLEVLLNIIYRYKVIVLLSRKCDAITEITAINLLEINLIECSLY